MSSKSSITEVPILILSYGFISLLSLPYSNAFIDANTGQFGQLGDQLSGYADGLYKNIDSWADHVISHAKDEDCQHICPYGKRAEKNIAFEFQPTGCGTFGIKIKESDLPLKEMRFCCDEHQICYHKCGSIKNECDEKLQHCLYQKCEKNITNEMSKLKGCKTGAKMLFMGVLTFGCKNFKESQKSACTCIGSDEF